MSVGSHPTYNSNHTCPSKKKKKYSKRQGVSEKGKQHTPFHQSECGKPDKDANPQTSPSRRVPNTLLKYFKIRALNF